jgi:hypothetical protein
MRLALLAATVVLAASLGCSQPQTCDARGASTPVSGVVSYALGEGAGSTFAGSIVVFDYSQECTYDDEEFPVSLGGCRLWASLQQGAEPSSRYFPGNPDGWAAIEPGQVCDLPLVDGTVTVTIIDGTLDFAESTTTLVLSGAVTPAADGGEAGTGGALQWIFQGSGWPG